MIELRHAEDGRLLLSELAPPFGFALYRIRAMTKKAY
jgi:hypothetical protein